LSDVGFYHLTRTGPDQALPQLLGRTLAAGQRALVLCGSGERVAALDAALWQSADPDWLPHGTAADGDADLQPIWLTTEDASANGAQFLFLIDGVQSERFDAFDRVFDLFDGTDDAAVAAARARWMSAKAAGHTLTYWQQGPRGWEKKA
jgi:DNA polymerase III subunit chi